ncbi:MAG: LamG-like jellyroll fold domain-containing protein, partial [Planctomycetota bacterium]
CDWIRGSIRVDDGQWHHVAVTWNMDEDSGHTYVDGVEGTYVVNFNGGADNTGNTIRIGFSPGEHSADFIGQIDDVRIYDHALSEIEVLGAMQGEIWPYAWGPEPADGALLSDTWTTLSWKPGGYAVSNDVYLGDKFDDVNDGTRDSDVFRGNQGLGMEFYIAGFAPYAYPDGLVNGTTYYWRIDEVNEAEPNSPWKGEVWSFMVPPKTAYYPEPADDAEFVDLNVQLTWTAGFNAKIHYIVFGEDFDDVSNAEAGIPSGPANYSPGPLKLAKTYYWRVDESDGFETHKGQIWSFTTTGAVSGPNPVDGALDVSPTQILSWDAGAVAASHEVYFGADADAVAHATKTSPEYKGTKALGEEIYNPGKLLLETTYYWRIDEVNDASPDSPWIGKVWNFTTGNYFVIDDFEDYDDGDNQIWFSWHDGLGYGVPGSTDYYPGNGTGSAVGDEVGWSSMELVIVHGGQQSVPFFYDNNKQGFAYYSEGEHTLMEQRDWTEEGVTELSLWFRGYPGSVGSFIEGPTGTYTMTSSGTDIWDNADEFHFAHKMLTGVGSIVARVESVEQTNNWAKAGVMIRESLEPGSVHAMMVVTPAQGVSFQRRTVTDDASSHTTTGEIEAPYWVKIERDVAGNFTAYSSANGSTWEMQGSENIQMSSNVYIGLALTSHDAALTCQAVLSNVTITGTVGPQWMNHDIGISSNDAEPLYVAVSNPDGIGTGQTAVVVHDDANAAQIDTWTEWVVPLQVFADQGIDLINVDKIAIGLGTKGNMTVPGGFGKMYFDDIRLYRPREAVE